ncbi:MAG TPA: 2-C-methyl-D-erythritol 4-phosphate cytidylyltransferase [Nocardioidaceae bacterium]|jgi:2-C-methyl-D-erythritol 4-phosphate cytidylyltransferase
MVGTTDAEPGSIDPGDPVEPVGVVPVTGRGSLPFVLLHGDPLVVLASTALEDAGVELLDFTETWAAVREMQRPVVLHDPLCPLTPVSFLRAAVEESARSGAVVVGVRPVTDTVKREHAGVVAETVDRDALWAVVSPVVIPVPVVVRLPDWPHLDDFASLVTWFRSGFEVAFLEAPPTARRVEDESAVLLLESIDEERPGP